jgi:hypothetical protein
MPITDLIEMSHIWIDVWHSHINPSESSLRSIFKPTRIYGAVGQYFLRWETRLKQMKKMSWWVEVMMIMFSLSWFEQMSQSQSLISWSLYLAFKYEVSKIGETWWPGNLFACDVLMRVAFPIASSPTNGHFCDFIWKWSHEANEKSMWKFQTLIGKCYTIIIHLIIFWEEIQ